MINPALAPARSAQARRGLLKAEANCMAGQISEPITTTSIPARLGPDGVQGGQVAVFLHFLRLMEALIFLDFLVRARILANERGPLASWNWRVSLGGNIR
ncbi:MAG: hypothetical protein DHS20C05_21530 [Hyphococcus sp.]|nr:MAG: hypothetical protein DHS20C05_21530 [Marinicaulis sp.]